MRCGFELRGSFFLALPPRPVTRPAMWGEVVGQGELPLAACAAAPLGQEGYLTEPGAPAVLLRLLRPLLRPLPPRLVPWVFSGREGLGLLFTEVLRPDCLPFLPLPLDRLWPRLELLRPLAPLVPGVAASFAARIFRFSNNLVF